MLVAIAFQMLTARLTPGRSGKEDISLGKKKGKRNGNGDYAVYRETMRVAVSLEREGRSHLTTWTRARKKNRTQIMNI